MFHQVEGIYVGENVSFANLKDLINKIVYSLFSEDIQIRFRPSYFLLLSHPLKYILANNDKWLEILGCGVVNPIVLDNCRLTPINSVD